MNSTQAKRLIGNDYKCIKGMEQYIEELRQTKSAAEMDKFMADLQNTPTIYFRMFEWLLQNPSEYINPLHMEYRSGVRLVNNKGKKDDIATMILWGDHKYNVADIVEYTSRENPEEFVIVKDPDVAFLDFEIQLGDLIMEEVEAEMAENGPTFEYFELDFGPAEQKKRELAERCVEAEKDYKSYMAELKKTDPEEHKRMTKLHDIYKKEHSKLRDIDAKIARVEKQIGDGDYYNKQVYGLLTDKEDKKWDELEDKLRGFEAQKRELIQKYEDENDKRVEDGVISQRHARLRAEQIFRGDYSSLPMRTFEESKAAGQYTDYEIDPETNERIYAHEHELLGTPELDSVTRNDPAKVEEARRIEDEHKRRLAEFEERAEERMRRAAEERRTRVDLAEKGVEIPKNVQTPVKSEAEPEKAAEQREEEKEEIEEIEEMEEDEIEGIEEI